MANSVSRKEQLPTHEGAAGVSRLPLHKARSSGLSQIFEADKSAQPKAVTARKINIIYYGGTFEPQNLRKPWILLRTVNSVYASIT
jgi:hypothetical protein